MLKLASSTPLVIAVLLAVIGLGFSFWRSRRIGIDALRFFLVAALIGLALSGPSFVSQRSENNSRLTALVDVSRSAQRLDNIKEIIRQLPPGTRCIAFGEKTYEGGCDSILSVSSEVVGDKTDLAAALAKVRGEVVLLSDGLENYGSAEVMLSSDSTKLRIFPVILDQQLAAARIGQVTYQPFVKAQQKITLGISSIDIPSYVREDKQFTLSVKRSSVPDKTTKKALSVGVSQDGVLFNSKVDLEFTPAEKFRGLEEFVISLQDGAGKTVDSRSILVGTDTEREVLVISSEVALGAPLAETLREQGFNVIESRDGSFNDFTNFRAIILVNTSRSELSSGSEARISSYVKNGGTVIMTGGPKSFIPGGYKGSVIADLLPINMLPPETIQKRLSVAVALVLDKSGSMAQGEKLDGAKGAAREVVSNLKDEDTIAIIGFDDAPFVVLRASPVGQVRDIAGERIGRLFPAGRTNLIPALDEARRMLSKVDAGRKHVIVMTDGRLPDEGEFYFELLRQMRLAGITASTVLLGGDNDFSFLKQLADVGGGGFYQTSDPRMLPRIFLQDIKVSVNAPTPPGAFETREVKPVSVHLGEYPDLTSVVPAAMKPEGTLELAVLDGGDRGSPTKPLLASWSVGNGRGIAFMADVVGQQTVAWFRWKRFGEFWRELISNERSNEGDDKKQRDPSIDFTVEQRGEYTALNLTVYDIPPKGRLDWHVTNPDGSNVSYAQFNEVLPSRYRAIIRTPQAGKYIIRAAEWLAPFGFSVSESDFKDREPVVVDVGYLRRLATMTGGAVLQVKDIAEVSKIALARKTLEEREDLTWLACIAAMIFQLLGMLLRSSAKTI